jgi:hypothetical protein
MPPLMRLAWTAMRSLQIVRFKKEESCFWEDDVGRKTRLMASL